MKLKVLIQAEAIDLDKEHRLLQNSDGSVGAIATFYGTVRDSNENRRVQSIFIEHYSGMTETNLKNIINEAKERWKISAATIIHRIGKLEVGEGIVFVVTASSHRKDAFQSCDFIMDSSSIWIMNSMSFKNLFDFDLTSLERRPLIN